MTSIIKKFKSHFLSLRKRAIFSSVVISLLIVMVSFFGYLNTRTLYEKSYHNLQKRDELLTETGAIRREIFTTSQNLNNFLLQPEERAYKDLTLMHLDEAIEHVGHLQDQFWVIQYNKVSFSEELKEKLDNLKKEINELTRIRLDQTNQYPSLAVGARVMQPNRNSINNNFALAINEFEQENYQVEKPKIYNTLIQARHLWGQMLSNSRMYLANRVGTFNTNALPVQEKAIEVMNQELRSKLDELYKYAEADELGFESATAVETIIESLEGWFGGYKEVKVINHSNEWRKDAQIMKQVILPEFKRIDEDLASLEQIVKDSSQKDVQLISELSSVQNNILWFIAFIGVIFSMLLILTLDRLVFKPINLISQALKREAMGKRSDHIPVVKAEETQMLVSAFSEMSRQVHLRQTELEYRALHDSLTSLPNRTLLLDRISQDIKAARRENHQVSLLIIDLDNFKEINDTLGHHAGDKLLVEIGARISKLLRDVDTVARIGGDEFAVILPHTNEEQSVVTAQKIINTLKSPLEVDGVGITVAASIGIAIFPAHGEDVHVLLRYADIAMYVAKRNKLGFEIYNENKDQHSVSRLSLSNDFRDALENDDLNIVFQPIYDMKSNKINGVEVLTRWEHETQGNIIPDVFVALAEQTGQVNQLTYWVLDKAMTWVSKWHQQKETLALSINLSVLSFSDSEFIGEIRSILRKYTFPYEMLSLEITEGAMMENPIQAIEVLTQLHEMGIRLSVDDFGTGFSSMTYLKQLPVDELKIDKSFVIGMDQDKSNDAIVRSTIDLAHNLGLQVIAEGIETSEVKQMLHDYNCDLAQGYYLSRPVSAEEMEKLLGL